MILQIWDRAEGAKILLFLGPEMRFYKGKWYNEVQKQSIQYPLFMSIDERYFMVQQALRSGCIFQMIIDIVPNLNVYDFVEYFPARGTLPCG